MDGGTVLLAGGSHSRPPEGPGQQSSCPAEYLGSTLLQGEHGEKRVAGARGLLRCSQQRGRGVWFGDPAGPPLPPGVHIL